MGHQLKIYSTIILLIFSLSSCLKDADLTGMFIPDGSVNQRFEQSMTWNSLNPEKEIFLPGDKYMILCMSDSHVGGIQNLNALFDSAFNTNAAAIIMAGDLTTGHEKDYLVFQQQLPDYDLLPTFKITGNHDLYFGGWKHFYSVFGSSTYTIKIFTPTSKDLFICLDTGSGTIGSKQLEWFKNILQAQRKEYRKCILVTHNNLFRFRRTSSTNPLTEELYLLLDLFTKYRVDMVITGHDHKKDVQKFGHTTHIIMDALKDKLTNAGYLRLMIDDDNISYKFINF